MTKREGMPGRPDWKALLAADEDGFRAVLQTVLQDVLEVEMTAALQAGKGERTAERLGYRSGYYGRSLITLVGTLGLRVPQDRQGRFSTELFERYQRSEKALVSAPGGDVRPGRVDPQGEGGDREAVRARVLGLGGEIGDGQAGCEPQGVRRAAAGRALSRRAPPFAGFDPTSLAGGGDAPGRKE